MKIDVELNKQSIKNAVKELKNVKKVIQDQLMPEYMQRSAEWIKDEANRILYRSDIGAEVVQAIASRWSINKISNDHIVLHNSYWKSAFVEFGVGIIGQTDKHPNADQAGYEYDVDSEHKFGQGFWQFNVDDASKLDLPKDAIVYQDFDEENGLSIITQGTKGVWYLFNAVENYKLREQKRLWEELKEKYLG